MTHLRQTVCMYGVYWPTWWWFHLYLKWWSCRPSSRGRWCPGSGRFPGTGWWRWTPHRWDHPAAGEIAVVCVWEGEGDGEEKEKEWEILIWRVFYSKKVTSPVSQDQTAHQLLWCESQCFLIRHTPWCELRLDSRRTRFSRPVVFITWGGLFFMSGTRQVKTSFKGCPGLS